MLANLRNNAVAIPALLCLYSATSVLAQMSSSNTACTKHYVVQSGDTCDKIGQKTMTSTYQVMSLNLPYAGSSCYTLEIGNQLCLGTYGNDCQMVHRVGDTDSCGTITSKFNITKDILLSNNPNADCGSIYDGLVLCVAPGIIRPPADPSLNVSYNALYSTEYNVNATMPMGTNLIAVNAALIDAPVIEIVSVVPIGQAVNTSAATNSSSSSNSTAAAHSSNSTIANLKAHQKSPSGKDETKTKSKSKHGSKHTAKGNSHHGAAKRYQMEHGSISA